MTQVSESKTTKPLQTETGSRTPPGHSGDMTNGWAIHHNDHGLIHILPVNDLKPHVHSDGCWCKPFEEEGSVVHNSMDRRELYERGERIAS